MKIRITKLVLNISTFLVTCLLLVFFIFGWYTSNKNVNANGISASTADVKNIFVDEEVTTERHNLNGDLIYDTYKVMPDGVLYLTKRIINYKDTSKQDSETNYETSEKISFNISEMLPGEFIDITISFSMTEIKNNSPFKISLNNIKGDEFKLDDSDPYVHNASCAFKYANISLYDSSNNEIFDYSSNSDYEWFNIPRINSNDQTNFDVQLCSQTRLSSYGKLFYTFRIYEDFEKYYDLINKASNVKGALLSRKNLIIEKIFIL